MWTLIIVVMVNGIVVNIPVVRDFTSESLCEKAALKFKASVDLYAHSSRTVCVQVRP